MAVGLCCLSPPQKTEVYHRRESDGWLTPPHVLAAVLGAAECQEFDLDPCSPCDDGPVPAKAHFTRNDDGLAKCWHGLVWCNPPYSQAAEWVGKCHSEADAGAQVLALVFAKTDTRWWHQHIAAYADVLLLQGRLRFSRVDGRSAGSAPFGSALILWNAHELASRLTLSLDAHWIPAKNDLEMT